MTSVAEVSLVLGIGVTRDREKGTVTIALDNDAKCLLERYDIRNCNPTCGKRSFPGQVRVEPSEHEEQAITGSVIYLEQVIRYDILYSVNHRCDLSS